MLFQVQITIKIPHGIDKSEVKRLSAIEIERAKELQQQGKWLHIWRVAGKWANTSIFDLESIDELHQVLSSLPLFPYMEIDVIPLCRHPASL
jgi:muconolactone D-isomerase